MLGRIILIIGIGVCTYIMDRPTPAPRRQLDTTLLQQDLREGKIKRYQALHIWNHIQWFPTILIIYLSHLVIQQSGLMWWDVTIWFQLIDGNILMLLLIISGIATARDSDLADIYIRRSSSIYMRYAYIWLCLILALLTYHILQTQLSSPDAPWIYTAISICAWWLIWLVWLVIWDEEETLHSS